MTTILALFLGATTALVSPSPATSRHDALLLDEMVFEDGDRLSGTIQARDLSVPSGVTVYAAGDLTLNASRSITIAGDLLAQDAELILGAVNAPSIALQSAGRLAIFGRVVGGSGRSAHAGAPDGTAGGAGSEVVLDCPDFLVSGRVLGGAGGDAAPGGTGGPGGSIFVFGTTRTAHGLSDTDLAGLGAHTALVAGAGGVGGDGTPTLDGGAGGPGGGVTVSLAASAAFVKALELHEHVFCPRHGQDSPDMPAVMGGRGGVGGKGRPGTASSPDGERGGDGGDCRLVQGLHANPVAEAGQDCCNLSPVKGGDNGTAGNGGNGGGGGDAVGGQGGAGGPGGDPFSSANVAGTEGLGGSGGSGGGAFGGYAGSGGDGGNGARPGSAGKAAKGGKVLRLGPGLGGAGFGGLGPSGGTGNRADGGDGTVGIGGGLCPE